ncbi:MAG: alpha/beta hydrolase [Sphingorhabdus sp.]
MPTIRANGIDLYFEDSGPADAPVVLLVMGLGTQMIAWPGEFVQGLVDAGFRVVNYDNRDIGLSTRLDGAPAPNLFWVLIASRLGLPLRLAYSLEDMAADGAGLLEALGIEKAHVVGASMGGMIAQHIAAAYPHRVNSLTSIMSTSGRPGLPGPDPQIRRRLMSKRPLRPSRDEAIAMGAEALRSVSYPDSTREPTAFAKMAARAFDRSYNPEGMYRQLVAIIADGSRVSQLKAICTPTLVVHGAADRLVPKACSEDIVKHVAGAKLEIVEEMAHDLPPSQVGRLVALIAGHARSVRC